MKILIAGATGFIGKKLVGALVLEHQITVLGRDLVKLKRLFPHAERCVTWDTLSDVDARQYNTIINLSGYNISGSRWNKSVKQQLIDSRVNTTKALIDWVLNQQAKPHFICANAVGIYGLQGSQDNRQLDEDSPINCDNPIDFMSEIGVRWQQALQPAIHNGLPVTSTRFGVVLAKEGGMLKKLTPSFYMGLGSVLGDGKQVLSWIDSDDLIAALLFLINHPQLTGVFNLCSPNPVTQSEFAHTLALVMHRPLFLKMPAFLVRLIFGEMGDCLLLKGQSVIPTRLLQQGYIFQYPKLIDALQKELIP